MVAKGFGRGQICLFDEFDENETQKLNENKRILIVEDDECLKPPLNRMIEAIDPHIEVKWVDSVKDAKRELASCRYSLMLVDYALDGGPTGLDLWHYCSKKYPEMPFIIISGLEIEAFLKLFGKEEVAPPFLPKPFYLGECRQFIQHFLKR